jgi:hypothetical protein
MFSIVRVLDCWAEAFPVPRVGGHPQHFGGIKPQTLYPADFVDPGGNSQSRSGNSGHRATNAWRGKAQPGQEEDLQEGREGAEEGRLRHGF